MDHNENGSNYEWVQFNADLNMNLDRTALKMFNLGLIEAFVINEHT